jgi:hypothetical protein
MTTGSARGPVHCGEPLRKRGAASFANDRGATRTLDQRINVPHRLSPTTVASKRPKAACRDWC